MTYFANAGQLLLSFVFGALIALFVLRLLAEAGRVDFRNPFSQMLYRYSNPVLAPLRRALPNWRRINLAALLVAWLLEMLEVLLGFALYGLMPAPGGWLLLGVAGLLNVLVWTWIVLIFVWSLGSLLGGDAGHPLLRFVAQLVQPLMRPLQRRLPSLGGLDFSPTIAILALLLARILVVQPLLDLGNHLALGA